MEDRTFYTRFIGVNALALILVSGTLLIPTISQHFRMGLFSMIFFSIFVWVAFLLGKKAASSKNLNDFTRLAIGLIFAKFAVCIIGVLLYNKIATPSDNLYLIPFFSLYLLYSFFEFRVLSKLGYSGKS